MGMKEQLDQQRAAQANSAYWAKRNQEEQDWKDRATRIRETDVGIKLPDAPVLNPFQLGDKYKAKDPASDPAFAQLRNDVISQNNAAKSGAMSALERKFAAMGNLNSGAYIKQSQIADQNYNEQGNKALNDLYTGIRQQEGQKEFQSGEAFNQRQFAASGQDRQDAITVSQNQFDNQTKLGMLKAAYWQQMQNAKDSAFNADMANMEANKFSLLGWL